jgi:segregation and condensation protein A
MSSSTKSTLEKSVGYEVFYEGYRGPLEGLLESCRSEDVQLSQLDLTELIDDFSYYLRNHPELRVNVSSEYLLLFSELVRIKTRELLPGDEEPEDDEPEGPEEREDRQFYQEVSERLREQAEQRSRLYESTPDSLPEAVREGRTEYREVTLYELIEAFRDIMATTRENKTPNIELTNEFETADQMEYVTARAEDGSPVDFRDLLSSTPSREEIIVTFLAILQLVKQGDLRLIQAVSGGSIKVVTPGELDGEVDP